VIFRDQLIRLNTYPEALLDADDASRLRSLARSARFVRRILPLHLVRAALRKVIP